MNNLKIIRKKRNKNQLNVAVNVGISQTQISLYERGLVSPPPDVLIKLAKFFDTSTDYLLGLTNNDTPIRYLDNNNLSQEELDLLNLYNMISIEDRKSLINIIKALAKVHS